MFVRYSKAKITKSVQVDEAVNFARHEDKQFGGQIRNRMLEIFHNHTPSYLSTSKSSQARNTERHKPINRFVIQDSKAKITNIAHLDKQATLQHT